MNARRSPGRTRERGVALLTVLLVVAVVAMLGTALTRTLWQAQRRVETAALARQARACALGAEALAAAALAGARGPRAERALAQPVALAVEGGTLEWRLLPLSGRFDLNALVKTDGSLDAERYALFERLLRLLGLKAELAAAIADWIDADRTPRFPGGAEDAEYALERPPYAAANRPLVSVGELRAVRGIDAAAWAKLAPLLAALPQSGPLDVASAPGALLAALAGRIGSDDRAAWAGLEAARDGRDCASVESCVGELPAGVELAVGGDWFELHARARVGRVRTTLVSLLHREAGTRITVQSRHEETP